MKWLIKIREGVIRFLYSEPIFSALKSLPGKRRVERLSEIVYNEEEDCWEVHFRGKVLYRGATREDCVQWENENMHKEV